MAHHVYACMPASEPVTHRSIRRRGQQQPGQPHTLGASILAGFRGMPAQQPAWLQQRLSSASAVAPSPLLV